MINSRFILMLAACGLLSLCCGCPAEKTADSHAAESAVEHAAHSESGSGHAEHAEHGEHAEPDEHAGHAESAAGHAEHAETGEAGGHEGHDHAELVSLTPEQLEAFGVEVATAGSGSLDLYLTLPGEVAVNEDKVGHVLPKLEGVVQKVSRNIGDKVSKGDLLAVVDSRELAEAKAEYVSIRERLAIARTTSEREKELFEKGLTPEQDYINAQNAVREVEIELKASAQTLSALGVSQATLDKLGSGEASLTRYEIYAPISGRILEKHVSVGEFVSTSNELFLIADLSSVWVLLNVSQKDLPRVSEGQSVRIRFSPSSLPESGQLPEADASMPDAQGKIEYIDALVAEDTRTAQARVVLSNTEGLWRPGMFVTGMIVVDDAEAAVLVPLDAVIKYEGASTVFIQDEHGFEPRSVTTGRQSATHVEILSGLKVGERYVSKGSYMVKAELGKSEASHGH